LLNPPKQDALGYPGGVSFNPPAVVNDAELPVCNENDNEQADVNPPPHLFFDNSNPAYKKRKVREKVIAVYLTKCGNRKHVDYLSLNNRQHKSLYMDKERECSLMPSNKKVS
jgi:hypothetical protein